MQIALITSHARPSCRELADQLVQNGHVCHIINPFNEPLPKVDYVFSYGCSVDTGPTPRLNKQMPVLHCIHKEATLNLMKKAGVPCPEFLTDHMDVPPEWRRVVMRKDANGRRAEGMTICAWEDMDYYQSHLCNFFTEYFPHRNEYRVVIFRGELVGVYHKTKKADGLHHFNIQDVRKGYDKIIESCKRAAMALSIDYVGFDVVAASKTKFQILEANSGPILTEEAGDAIVNYFNQL